MLQKWNLSPLVLSYYFNFKHLLQVATRILNIDSFSKVWVSLSQMTEPFSIVGKLVIINYFVHSIYLFKAVSSISIKKLFLEAQPIY